jgi:hypothetical protein
VDKVRLKPQRTNVERGRVINRLGGSPRVDECIVCWAKVFPGTYHNMSFNSRMCPKTLIRTRRDDLLLYVRNILRENNSKATRAPQAVSMGSLVRRPNIRIQVPVDVTVQEPWPGVVSEEPNSHDVGGACSDAHDIANDGVDEVI